MAAENVDGDEVIVQDQVKGPNDVVIAPPDKIKRVNENSDDFLKKMCKDRSASHYSYHPFIHRL